MGKVKNLRVISREGISSLYKRCPVCEKVLLLSSFHSDKAQRDGKNVRCKPCDRIKVRTYMREHNYKVSDNKKEYNRHYWHTHYAKEIYKYQDCNYCKI